MASKGDFADFQSLLGSSFAEGANASTVEIFNCPTYTVGGTVAAVTWSKPKHATMVLIYTASSAGGGGGGRSHSLGAGGGGGGGGGSGAFAKLLIPALFLPDRLQIAIPTGGPGGAAGSSGTGGGDTMLFVHANVRADNLITSTSTAAQPGAAGAASAGGAGGGGAATTSVRAQRSGAGFWEVFTGNTGAGGAGNSILGEDMTILPGSGSAIGNPLHGGLGGAGNSVGNLISKGGEYSALANSLTSHMRPQRPLVANEGASGTPPPFNKSVGFNFWGAMGGASYTLGNGQKGGDGAWGCGGGGGGAGVSTGGAGGKGGDGFCIIICF